tara:strand:- start:1030 stop:1245 length:216 start_codon:yes stop_codon:yes gene_type:complete
MYSLFDSFFAPTRVIVVSEERLKAAEVAAKKDQLNALDKRLEEMNQYRLTLASELKEMTEPQSLEEALTGE